MTADFNLASVERKKSLIYTRPFSDRSSRTFFARAATTKRRAQPWIWWFSYSFANGVSRATKSWNLCVFDGGFIEINCQFAFSRKFCDSRPRNFSRSANPGLSHFRAIVPATLCCCDRQQFCFRLISGCRPPWRQSDTDVSIIQARDFHSAPIDCDFHAIVGRKGWFGLRALTGWN